MSGVFRSEQGERIKIRMPVHDEVCEVTVLDEGCSAGAALTSDKGIG